MSIDAAMARIQVSSPRRFTAGAFLAMGAFSVILVLPLLIAAMVVSVLQFGLLTFLIPLATMAAATLFLPLALGNAVVTRLVRANCPEAATQPGFIVQLSTTPRLQTGARALFEDADDVGFLSFTDDELLFRGDSAELRIPWGRVEKAQARSVGWRGFFLYGFRTAVQLRGVPQIEELEFSERSSFLLSGSRKTARRLLKELQIKQQAARTEDKA